jgi:hypothetical protein
MPSYAPGSLSIAICGRCKMKRKYTELSNDPNIPGLRVCQFGCSDQIDPYRLPPRQVESVNLRWPRPDRPLYETEIPFLSENLEDDAQVEVDDGGDYIGV